MATPEDREDWNEDDWREERAHDEMEEVREWMIERGDWDLKPEGGEDGMLPDVELVCVHLKWYKDESGYRWEIARHEPVFIASTWLNSLMMAEQRIATDERPFVALTDHQNLTINVLGTIAQLREKMRQNS